MTWFKVDDGFHSHPKVLMAGNEAVGLWVRCGAYCSQHLTEGRVPRAIALMYGDISLINILVKVGLFEPCEDDWLVHDFLEYNPTRAQVTTERKAAAERQRVARERARASKQVKAAADDRHGVTHAVSHAVTSGEVTHVVTPVVTVPPTRPDPTRTSYGSTEVQKPMHASTQPDGALFPAPEAEPAPPPPDPMARFQEFYKAYPRHVAPARAEKAWKNAVQAGADPAVLIDAARMFAMERKFSDKKLIPYPATWLNDRRWEDEPDPEYIPPQGAGGFEPNGNSHPATAPSNELQPFPPPGFGTVRPHFGPKPSTTDQRVAQGLALAEYYRARGE